MLLFGSSKAERQVTVCDAPCSNFWRKIDKKGAACAVDQPAAALSGGSVTLLLI